MRNVYSKNMRMKTSTVPAAYFSRMRMCMFSLCMRLTNEFGTQMKNAHTDLIRIRIYAYAISEKYAAGAVCQKV